MKKALEDQGSRIGHNTATYGIWAWVAEKQVRRLLWVETASR